MAFLLPQYTEEGKASLVVAVGCTGGAAEVGSIHDVRGPGPHRVQHSPLPDDGLPLWGRLPLKGKAEDGEHEGKGVEKHGIDHYLRAVPVRMI